MKEHPRKSGGRLVPMKVLVMLAAAFIVGVAFLAAQTAPKQKKAPRKTTSQTQPSSSQQGHVDTTARTRPDSTAPGGPADSTAAARSSPPPPFQYRKVQNDAFGVGERLTFSVNYGFINAGDAVMSIPGYDTVDGRLCYRVEFAVNSLPSFAWIYKVEDRYLTYIDVDAIAPLKFEQHIREGTYRRDFIAEFDQANHIARTSDGQYPIPEYVHDIMSAFYYVRTIDFSSFLPGEVTTLHNFYKDKSYELGVRFLGRQELDLAAGTFRTLVVEPLVKEGGLFKSEGRIVIWLSDDDRKIPVRVNTKVIIGSIDVELTSYTGLVGPLRARVK